MIYNSLSNAQQFASYYLTRLILSLQNCKLILQSTLGDDDTKICSRNRALHILTKLKAFENSLTGDNFITLGVRSQLKLCISLMYLQRKP